MQRFIEHRSHEIGLPMRFSVYLPPQAAHTRVPALLYLAGLTCDEETFAVKAGAQRMAASLGVALIAPDTSPRGAGPESLPGAKDSWDFGIGAGFYLDATAEPWATHWRMESWIVHELLPLVARHFPIDGERIGIFGHWMGGHGALTLALRHPGRFKSLSAFAPICAPTQCPWGQKAFAGYLGEPGDDRAQWLAHDASALMQSQTVAPIRRASSSTRAWPTNSSPSNCTPRPSRPPASPPASRSRCAAMRATTTATTSSRASWRTTSRTTRRR